MAGCSVLAFEGIRLKPEGGHEVINKWFFTQRCIESSEVVLSPDKSRQVVILRTVNREYIFWSSYPSNEADKLAQLLLEFAGDQLKRRKVDKLREAVLRATHWRVVDARTPPLFLTEPRQEPSPWHNQENSTTSLAQWDSNSPWLSQLMGNQANLDLHT